MRYINQGGYKISQIPNKIKENYFYLLFLVLLD